MPTSAWSLTKQPFERFARREEETSFTKARLLDRRFPDPAKAATYCTLQQICRMANDLKHRRCINLETNFETWTQPCTHRGHESSKKNPKALRSLGMPRLASRASYKFWCSVGKSNLRDTKTCDALSSMACSTDGGPYRQDSPISRFIPVQTSKICLETLTCDSADVVV